MVVDGGQGAQFVEALDQHALVVHVGEAQRTVDPGHASLPGPLLDRAKQQAGHLGVVDEVHPPKTGVGVAPSLYVFAVDDAGNAADDLSVPEGEPVFGLAVLEGGILVGPQRMDLVEDQRRHPVRMVLIQGERESDELLQVRAGRNFLDEYLHVFDRAADRLKPKHGWGWGRLPQPSPTAPRVKIKHPAIVPRPGFSQCLNAKGEIDGLGAGPASFPSLH